MKLTVVWGLQKMLKTSKRAFMFYVDPKSEQRSENIKQWIDHAAQVLLHHLGLLCGRHRLLGLMQALMQWRRSLRSPWFRISCSQDMSSPWLRSTPPLGHREAIVGLGWEYVWHSVISGHGMYSGCQQHRRAVRVLISLLPTMPLPRVPVSGRAPLILSVPRDRKPESSCSISSFLSHLSPSPVRTTS